jgi:hypothetical protein
MLDSALSGRRISTPSVEQLLARVHRSQQDSAAILKLVAAADRHQQESIVYARDVIRQCRAACAKAAEQLSG